MKLVPAHIAHARVRPRRNAFGYRLCYFAIPVAEWVRGTKAKFFSFDRGNLFSLRSSDFGDGVSPPAVWIRRVLAAQGIGEADGEIVLLTLPRLMGYAFNPVSFWFCFDRAAQLRVVVSEVNNTFGERHCYLCCRADHAPIAPGEILVAQKVFHVSPFLEVKGSYRFRFSFEPEKIAVHIDVSDDDGLLLSTSIAGRPAALTACGLLRAALAYPLQTIKVVALIHYQALRLWLKRIPNHRKPSPPKAFVS